MSLCSSFYAVLVQTNSFEGVPFALYLLASPISSISIQIYYLPFVSQMTAIDQTAAVRAVCAFVHGRRTYSYHAGIYAYVQNACQN